MLVRGIKAFVPTVGKFIKVWYQHRQSLLFRYTMNTSRTLDV